MDARIKAAAGLLFGGLPLSGAAYAHPVVPVTEVRYACDGGQTLLVRASTDFASVQYLDRTYELRQKRSSIGQKYISPTASLIVDGRSAVFVADDGLQLAQCLETSRTAFAG